MSSVRAEEQKIYKVILKVIQRVRDFLPQEWDLCGFIGDTFSLKTAQVVVVSGMTEMLMRVVGWIVCDGYTECCSIHRLYLTDRAGGN